VQLDCRLPPDAPQPPLHRASALRSHAAQSWCDSERSSGEGQCRREFDQAFQKNRRYGSADPHLASIPKSRPCSPRTNAVRVEAQAGSTTRSGAAATASEGPWPLPVPRDQRSVRRVATLASNKMLLELTKAERFDSSFEKRV